MWIFLKSIKKYLKGGICNWRSHYQMHIGIKQERIGEQHGKNDD